MNIKGLAPEYVAVDLRKEQHLSSAFGAVNPQHLVPALAMDDGTVLLQSPAIIEWLEEKYPDPPLLPRALEDRAKVRAVAALIGCDIHPVNNRRILETLRKRFGCDDAAVNLWCSTWISDGFDAIETLLGRDSPHGRFCFGDSPTVADVYLVPQVESARRFGVHISRWRRIQAVDAACSELPAFVKAAPANQVDAAL